MHLSDSFDYQALSIVVGMFNAASGAEVHQELRDYLESGDSPTTVVRNLLQTDAFQTLFPTQLSDAEFSSKFAFSLLGDEVSFPQLVEATFTLSGLLNAHMPREDVIWLAINALLSVPPENSSWIAARVAFESKIAVAEYYSVEKSKPSNSLEELQEVLKGVTADSKSVDDAIRIIDGNPLTSDEPDTSEEPDPSSDTTVYISSSDPSQVLSFDLGDGEDTVNITDSNGASIDLSSIEILNAEIFRLLSSSGLFNGLLSVNAPAWQSLTDVFVELQSPAESQAIELPDALSTATIVARGAETLSIEGGSGNLSVTNGDAPINVGVANGGAFTSVNVSGGSLVTIVDQRIENGNPVIQTGLTNVTLDGNTTVANLTGDGITTLTLLNDSVGAVLTNTTPNHALSLHTSNLSTGALVDDQSAGSVSINTSGGASIVSLDTPSAQLVTLTGDADLTLIDLSMSLSTLDAGAFTGNLNLTANSSSSPMTIIDGSGDDVLDLVAVSGALTVHNGEGNDTISAGNGTNYIDAGPGTDSIQLGGRSNIVHTGLGGDSVTSRNGSHQLYLEDGNDKISFLPLVALDDRDTLHEVHSGQKFAFLSSPVFTDTMSLTSVTLVGPNDTVQDYLNEIHQNTGNPGWRWFQAEGNTHLYFDTDDQSGFHAAYDAGIIFTGLLDLSALLTGSAKDANTFEFRVNDF